MPLVAQPEVVTEQSCVQKLAQLFPHACPLQLPVNVSSLGTGRSRLREQTVLEYGTEFEVLFPSVLPLEFEDRVRLVIANSSLDIVATVVAVRYHGGRKAVAVRFESKVPNWVIRS